MAKRFVRHAKRRIIEQSANGLTSMWQLWQILKSRAYATYVNCKDPEAMDTDTGPEDFWILHPHDYYGAFWCKPEYWEELKDYSNESTLTEIPAV